MKRRLAELEAELAAERKRREGVEDELHAERLAHTAAVTRAEQAERERDEAQREAADVGDSRTRWQQRAERAEADNAALLDVVRQMKNDDAWGADHPGAALLERMRALETFVRGFAEMAENVVAHREGPNGGMHVPYTDDFASLPPSGVDALKRWLRDARAALKVTP